MGSTILMTALRSLRSHINHLASAGFGNKRNILKMGAFLGVLSLVVAPFTFGNSNSINSQTDISGSTEKITTQQDQSSPKDTASDLQSSNAGSSNPNNDADQKNPSTQTTGNATSSTSMSISTNTVSNQNGNQTRTETTVNDGSTTTHTVTNSTPSGTSTVTIDAGSSSDVRVRQRGDKVRIDFRESTDSNLR